MTTPHSPSTAHWNFELDASSYEKSHSRARRAAGHIATGKARMPGVDFEGEAADAVFDLLDVESSGLVSPAYRLRRALRLGRLLSFSCLATSHLGWLSFVFVLASAHSAPHHVMIRHALASGTHTHIAQTLIRHAHPHGTHRCGRTNCSR